MKKETKNMGSAVAIISGAAISGAVISGAANHGAAISVATKRGKRRHGATS